MGTDNFSEVDSPALHFLLREWSPLSKDDWFVFVLVGMSSAFGGFLISQAYRKSEAAFIASFEYIAMPLSICWGILIFNNLPDAQSLLGMGMIIGSGLYTIWREAIRGKRQAKQLLGSPRFRR